MTEERLNQLLRQADAIEPAPQLADASAIAVSARAVRRSRQRRARMIPATLSLAVVIGATTSVIGWRNQRAANLALQTATADLELEASVRMNAMRSIAHSRKPKAAVRAMPRDISVELAIERERAAAIILQSAEQLREAGRSDFANDRYNDLITHFPDTAAAQVARERVEQVKNRT